MQIVIEIDEDIAQGIIDGKEEAPRNIVRSFQATIADAIKNGKPLPKGHGDLIDRKALMSVPDRKSLMVRPYEKGGYVDWYDEIKYADTIIEKEE